MSDTPLTSNELCHAHEIKEVPRYGIPGTIWDKKNCPYCKIECLQQRVAELKVAYDRMFDKAVELERIAADTRYAAEDRVRMIQDGAAHEPEARHTLDCDMVKHPNCTRCNCGSSIDTESHSGRPRRPCYAAAHETKGGGQP